MGLNMKKWKNDVFCGGWMEDLACNQCHQQGEVQLVPGCLSMEQLIIMNTCMPLTVRNLGCLVISAALQEVIVILFYFLLFPFYLLLLLFSSPYLFFQSLLPHFTGFLYPVFTLTLSSSFPFCTNDSSEIVQKYSDYGKPLVWSSWDIKQMKTIQSRPGINKHQK